MLSVNRGNGASQKGPKVVNPRSSPALLAAIVATAGDAILSFDEHGRITTWNSAAERLLGYPASDILGQSIDLLIPTPCLEEWQLAGQQATAEAAHRTWETTLRRRDGAPIEVEVTHSPLVEPDGPVVGFSAIVRDISERKAHEQTRRGQEFPFHTFFEHMPGPTYIDRPRSLGANGGLIALGQQFEAITGYPTEVWRTDEDFIQIVVHPDDRERFRAATELAARTGQPFCAEYRIVTRDGRVRWVRDQANPVFHADGRTPRYWMGHVLDISEQKLAEEISREAIRQLEETNQRLEELSRAKSELVAVISHELRTPLTNIQGFSELIATENLSPVEIRQFASTINESALWLGRMITNMLDLERLESGQAELTLNEENLNDLVGHVLATFQPGLVNHTFDTALAPDLPPIWGDEDLLMQVVTNLVANAIKYSPAGGAITVATRQHGGGIELTVADEGLGVPADQREAVFARYSRIVRAEQRNIEGAGLGLPIAKQIVGLHGGEIWVTDNHPTGSIFHVWLLPRPPSDEYPT